MNCKGITMAIPCTRVHSHTYPQILNKYLKIALHGGCALVYIPECRILWYLLQRVPRHELLSNVLLLRASTCPVNLIHYSSIHSHVTKKHLLPTHQHGSILTRFTNYYGRSHTTPITTTNLEPRTFALRINSI